MSHLPDIKIFIRNSNRELVGEVDDYRSLTVLQRFNAGGTITLEISGASKKAALLDPRTGGANPGGGLIVVRNGEILTSGPIHHFGWKRSRDEHGSGTLMISGPDDTGVLGRRLVWPVPANTITTQGTTYFYTVSGATTSMETLMRTLVNVQAGPGARTERRIPGLVLGGTDLLRGTATTFRDKFRFEPLPDALRLIAVAAPVALTGARTRGALGFQVQQVGTNLEFQVYQTTVRAASAKFSFDLGNIDDADYAVEAPTTTMAILGAGKTNAFTNGPGVASNLYAYERTDGLFGLTRAETFVEVGEIDPAASDVQAQLDEAAEQAYDTGAGRISLSFSPRETSAMLFRRDFFLGDYVTVSLPWLSYVEQIRQVTLELTPDGPEAVNLLVGPEGTYDRRTGGMFKRLSDLRKLLKKKEVTS